jgi:hypothetical protein
MPAGTGGTTCTKSVRAPYSVISGLVIMTTCRYDIIQKLSVGSGRLHRLDNFFDDLGHGLGSFLTDSSPMTFGDHLATTTLFAMNSKC